MKITRQYILLSQAVSLKSKAKQAIRSESNVSQEMLVSDQTCEVLVKMSNI